MLVYAHSTVEHRLLFGRLERIPAGTWREVRDGLGQRLLAQYPHSLCDVTGEREPFQHRCPLSEEHHYVDASMPNPPATTDMRTRIDQDYFRRCAPQKRRIIQKKLHGSLRFRREFYGVIEHT